MQEQVRACAVRPNPGATTELEARVWFDREHAEGVQIQKLAPEPERVEVGSERLAYVFHVDDESEGSRRSRSTPATEARSVSGPGEA
jgi:hypothetical protein